MRRGFAGWVVAGLLFAALQAHAVPSFSRQTGLSCKVCHNNPPQLTAFGRDFKLHGYLLTDIKPDEKVGNTKDLLLSKWIPLSALVLISNTSFQSTPPASQNNSAGFPQQLSLFLAGGYAEHFGGMLQFTYEHAADHFSIDNTDLRYANQGKLWGKDVAYGVTLNNNPSVEDVWNSTPAYGFPYISSEAAVGPLAAPLIFGALAQDVAGAGGYALWNNHLYADVTLYRSEHAGSPAPITGTGQAYNISGAAPYWRVAWQQNLGSSYLEVGSYGIYVNSFPGAVSGPEDRYVDPSFDLQFEHPFGPNLWDMHGSYTHETQGLNATYAAGGAATQANHLNAWKLDSTYHWRMKYTATGQIFSTQGNNDVLLYAAAPVTGSNNGSPNTNGYTVQVAYWPQENIDLSVNYTGYTKFNGASTNYDGAGRNAADNNTVYAALWINF